MISSSPNRETKDFDNKTLNLLLVPFDNNLLRMYIYEGRSDEAWALHPGTHSFKKIAK